MGRCYFSVMDNIAPSVGPLLQEWRKRRRLSQLALASEAEISQRHLSFVESGRAVPSRAMILRLSEALSVPLRERNVLLAAAGFAPVYGERELDSPDLEPARQAVELILAGHEPYPALAIDPHWHMMRTNRAVAPLLAGVSPELLHPPVNVLRLSLHPGGLAPRIRNFREWRSHVTTRLAQQVEQTADPALRELLDELKSYPVPPGAAPNRRGGVSFGGIAVPLELMTGDTTLRLLSTTTVFGTALDITLSELAIESFFPADAQTASALRTLVEAC